MTTLDKSNTNTALDKVKIYSFVIDTMKQNCNHSTCQKLDQLKRAVEKGFNSPITESINIFGVNLFVFDYKEYVKMYDMINGGL